MADAAAQRAWDARDMSTQVTTPALQKQQGHTSSSSTPGSYCSNLGGRAVAAAAAGVGGELAARAGKQVQQQGCQAGGGACDVSASPVKGKDQL
ncbi:hypothetical protein OEZ85_005341 [Tetradesmus obliquus]|uniref:SMP domain-containing protein n=1 Tax=Tetradesmus obliquus TaxID=3088 RepID=A0ABY8UKV5_TETOB|nr:hypothetical protein OEZ85_005341 [Tetradesmus obliquus]